MSKRSLFWGQASGKLGEAVYYRAGGEQRTRAYVAKIKNPKSAAQAANRVQMRNLSNVFKAYRSVLQKSFPNRKTNQSGFNAFVQANKSANSPAVYKDDYERGAMCPFRMQVSKGDLIINDKINFTSTEDSSIIDGSAIGLSKGTITGAAADYSVGKPLNGSDLYKLIVGDNNPYNLPSSFVLTILSAFYSYSAPFNGETWLPMVFRVECSESSTDEGVVHYAYDMSSTVVCRPYVSKITTDDNNVTVDAWGVLPHDQPVAVTEDLCVSILVSYVDANGKLQINTASMQDNAPEPVSESTFGQFLPGGALFNEAVAEYTASQSDILSQKS